MLALRTYKNEDARAISSWLRDEQVFLWWSAGKLGAYPLDPERLNAFYAPGIASGDWFPKAMEEDGRICGQLLMRWANQSEGWLHFGFIIVNPDARGKGLGYAMLAMALEYAFHIKGAKRVTLNVFADNAPAIRCYERLGFAQGEATVLSIDGKDMKVFRYEKRPANA